MKEFKFKINYETKIKAKNKEEAEMVFWGCCVNDADMVAEDFIEANLKIEQL